MHALTVGAMVLAAVAASAAKVEPIWESIDSRPTPSWFTEGKFGIFIHWGTYSVPSWSPKGTYAEWYWHAMQDKKGPTRQFHERVFGKDFPYENFAPMFKAELFNPDQWADVFARSGAKYVVLTSKHHEGFCLWPNAQANESWGRPWNSVDVGPKRDLLGDLSAAVRAKGLKMGFYYSLYEWFNPIYKADFAKFRDQHFFPQFKDVVSRYKPSIIFADGEWDHTSAEWRTPELLAWLFNESGCGDELVINDRWGKDTRGKHGGYYTTEYGGGTDFHAGPGHPWEEDRGIGASFGYNRNEDYDEYRTATDLVRLLIEMVSLGGNLLLDIGPTADGRIPVIMQDRLIEMGKWLQVNGDAIYGTTAGPFGKLGKDRWACTAKPLKLFIHVFGTPEFDGKVDLACLQSKVTKAYLLADKSPVAVTPLERGVALTLSKPLPDPKATVVVLEIEGEPKVDPSIYPSADGVVTLPAAAATIHGKTAKYESAKDKDCIGMWRDPKDSVSWEFTAEAPGRFAVEVTYACPENSSGSTYRITVDKKTMKGKVEPTESWSQFVTKRVGETSIAKPGTYTVSVTPADNAKNQGVMNLRAVVLRPVKK